MSLLKPLLLLSAGAEGWGGDAGRTERHNIAVNIFFFFVIMCAKIQCGKVGEFCSLSPLLSVSLCLNVAVCEDHRIPEEDCPSVGCPSYLMTQG